MTNYEKITQMSVEELAEFIVNGTIYLVNDLCDDATEPQPGNCKCCEFVGVGNCRFELVKKWLERI